MTDSRENYQEDFANQLQGFLEEEVDGVDATSFRDDGMLTRDAGFTAKMSDGSVFQVTVVQRHPAVGQEW